MRAFAVDLEKLGEVGTRGVLIIPVERTLPHYCTGISSIFGQSLGGLVGCRKWHSRGYYE